MVQFLTGISNICTATSGQITHICPGLSVNEIQIPNDKHRDVSSWVCANLLFSENITFIFQKRIIDSF